MQYDRMTLGRKAKELGFVRDTFEKVCRLVDVLMFLEQDAILKNCLALKGGTAINLTIFNLPRLSVDIDLDFSENLSRADMLEKRELITDHIEKYMVANGYSLSGKSKSYHALDSFVYEYQNAGGMRDNLKIEINYILRCHVLEQTRRQVTLPWMEQNLTVLSVDPVEIFASKIVALINRSAPRDLYDLTNMIRFGLFDESEQALLRKCAVFYSAIGSEETPTDFSFDKIADIQQNRIKSDLLPVLRNSPFFDVKEAQEECMAYLKELLILDNGEKDFLQSFRDGHYRPELLFSDPTILSRIAQHPMALWKCGGRVRSVEQADDMPEKPSVLEKLHSYSERKEETKTEVKPRRKREKER